GEECGGECDEDTWSLNHFYIQGAGSFGLTNDALFLDLFQSMENISATHNDYIGIIEPQSELTFDFKFGNINNFADDVYFYTINCDGTENLIYTINISNFHNDLNWHKYSIPIGSYAGDKVKIRVEVMSIGESSYSIAIDNFGIVNDYDVNLGNDTLLCFSELLSINTNVENEELYTYLWQGPNVYGDTNASIIATTAGIYSVVVYDAVGSIRTDSINVQYSPEITTNSTISDTSICLGDTTIINSEFFGSFPMIVNWRINEVYTTDTISNYLENNFSPNNNSIYSIASITDSYGCIINNVDSVNIIVNQPPVILLSGFNSNYCSNNDIDTIIANPIGGIYNGNVNSEGILDPSLLMEGNNQITYTYTDGNNCTNSDTININSNYAPTVLFSSNINSSYCLNNDSVSLSASPYGGSFNGSGVSDSIIQLEFVSNGIHYYSYTYTDINACTNSDSISIQMNELPIVNIDTLANACQDEPFHLIAGSGSPSGGYYFGNGVVNNSFFPTNAGVGLHAITYYYSDMNGCENSASTNIRVVGTPAPDFYVNHNICEPDTTTINYSSTVSSSATFVWNFDNAVVLSGAGEGPYELYWDTAGVKTINMTVNDSGCVNSNYKTVNVHSIPIVSFSANINSAYCMYSDSIILQSTPSGGQYTGNGITNNILYLNALEPNIYSYTYSYSDSYGCLGSDTIAISINPLPNVYIESLTDACENQTTVDLTSGFPAGGSYSGNAVSSSSSEFYPIVAGIGNHNIAYTYTDTNGCQNSDTNSLKVVSLPSAEFFVSNNYCTSDTAYINYTGMASSTAEFEWFFDNANHIFGTNNGPFEVVWDTIGNKTINVMVTDSGCTNASFETTVVNSYPTVAFASSINDSYCNNSDSLELEATPIGGQYSGNGLSNSVLYFDSINTGTHQYSYTYTDNNGCSASAFIDITINPLPTVTVSNFGNVCENQSSTILTGGIPSGGNYYGDAVSSSTSEFYPIIAGVGTRSIEYNYTDSNGCIGSDTATIEVISMPIANFTVDANICKSDTAIVNNYSTAGIDAIYNWTFNSANIISGMGEGPYELSWNNAGVKGISLSISDSGCTSTLFQNFTSVMEAISNISIIGSDSACYGEDIILFTNSGVANTFNWNDVSGAITSTQDTMSYFVALQSGLYFVENTNSNGCTAISDTISVTINPEINSNFTIPSITCTNDMVNINYAGTSGISAAYNWDFDSGNIASGSNSGPYNIIWNTDGIKNVSLFVEENNCFSDVTEKSIEIQTTPATIIALGNTSFCEGSSVTLSANTGPYTYEWFKNGITTSNTQALYQANEEGSYTVHVTNLNTNCSSISDSVAVIVNTTDFNIAFVANQTTFNTPPFLASFTNQTSNANDYYWMWTFGDGNTSTFINPNHQYNYDGDYTVELIAKNVNTGCFDTLIKNDYISCNGGSANPCDLDASFDNIGGNEVCPNDSVKLFANDHTSGVTYQWLRDGILISGASDSVYFASLPGLYQLMIADATCTEFSQPFALNQLTTVTPSILTNGDIQPCTNDSMELYVSTSFSSYQWSNGSNSQSIYINTSGSYIITVTDNNGCNSSSDPYVVNASLLQVPNICIVGIDSISNHNRIVWERTNNNMIDSFRIYRESTVSGVYDLIGSQDFSTLSVFEDVNSIPAQRAYRYRITAVDTCGMETAPSPIHKTLHLTINAGLGGVWNLIWTNYEGFNFGSYKIYRSSDSTDMQLLTQIQSNLTSYTDLNPPTGNVYYQIEIMSPNPCYPDSIFTKVNTNYNSSRSNTANTAHATNTSLFSHQNSDIPITIFPNPNNGIFTLEIGDIGNSDLQLSIINTIGSEVYNSKFSVYGKTAKQIDLKGLARGVYFIRLKTSKGIVYRGKVIIN
ncbi:MAG: T9SS type A sorting domain-containing protein, partial [Bacteroidales bacterium]|nr:T9SS type A sorting domain-containing protein [Bacteroidales bacterium]